MYWQELTDLQKRQYIDAESVFMALRDAEKTATAVRGSMLWRQASGARMTSSALFTNGGNRIGADGADDHTASAYV